MKHLFLIVLFSTIVLNLAACGGGGGGGGDSSGGENEVPPTTPVADLEPGKIPANRQDEWDEYVEKFEKDAQELMSGLYDVTVTNADGSADVGFLYVDSHGDIETSDLRITAFSFNAPGNCYSYAEGDMLNSALNSEAGMEGKGSTLKWVEPWSSANRVSRYQVEIAGQSLFWEFDKDLNLTTLGLGSITSKSHLVISSNGLKLSTVAQKQILGSVSIETINSNMCEGEPVGEEGVGSSLFSGLYDTTVMEGANKYESYLYIDESGLMSAYKYMGDGYDEASNENCYKVSPFYNTDLHGSTLMYDAESHRLMFPVDGFVLYWNLNDSGEIVSVNRSGEASAARYEDQTRSIAISSVLAEGVTIEDIEASICN